MLAWVSQFLMKDFQAFFSLVMPFFTFLLFISPLITLVYVFLWHHLSKLPLSLKVLHLLDQELSSILSRWPNQCCILPSKHFLMLFNLCLVLNSSAEVLFSSLLLLINLTIPASFLSSLITFSSLTCLLHSITLCTNAECNLSFARKEKLVLANKDTK